MVNTTAGAAAWAGWETAATVNAAAASTEGIRTTGPPAMGDRPYAGNDDIDDSVREWTVPISVRYPPGARARPRYPLVARRY
ncbi:hypothetical protein GCM10009733_086020 [Nonomuraea maheshkhaliensis]|uniref:Uncharacterized protein n=1 Tax=Nonomuraea maheshkhaliensis TaxID=419590 RepID=A0ABN2GRY3_9ACTN